MPGCPLIFRTLFGALYFGDSRNGESRFSKSELGWGAARPSNDSVLRVPPICGRAFDVSI
jgi:hypothetical protein